LHSAILLGGFSIVLCAIFVLLVAPSAVKWLQAPIETSDLVEQVVYILSASIPFIGVTATLRSILEAKERFPTIAAIQATLGSLTYAAPLLLSLVTSDIRVIVGSAVVCRVLAFVAFFVAARAEWPGVLSLKHAGAWDVHFLRFSGWLVISNVVGNAVVYADRALLVKLIPIAQLPFYNVPLEFLIRIMIVVNGAITVAFPYLSRMAADKTRFDKVYVTAVAAIGATLVPVLLVVSFIAPWGLEVWLGAEFRERSTEIVRLFLIGLLFLSLNAFALASLSARGLAHTIALMHLIEAPLYLWALWYFGRSFGFYGVAAVWSGRMVAEYVGYSAMQIMASDNKRSQISGAALGALLAVPLIVFTLMHQAALSSAICVLLTLVTLRWAMSTLRMPQPGVAGSGGV
jgi:O-antigen/teichoic acid export membrane protein